MFAGLGFGAPLVLIALAALPAIWLILRITPPQPRRIPFPPLRVIADLMPRRETPARTPWWLLALRLALAAALILAVAGPVWNPITGGVSAPGPLVIAIDNGFAAARDWDERTALAEERIMSAERQNRPVAIVGLADRPDTVEALAPGAAMDRLRALAPQPHVPDRASHLATLGAFLSQHGEAEIAWISDGIAFGADGFADSLGEAFAGRTGAVTIYRNPVAEPLMIADAHNGPSGIEVRLVRAGPNGRDTGTLRALDTKGLLLAEMPFSFSAGASETTARFDLPVELDNAVARLEIAGETSAGAVGLIDESGKRRRVGLVSGGTVDTAQPLLSPTYYVSRALAPYAELREARRGIPDPVGDLVDQGVNVLVLADVGSLDSETETKLARFVEEGGLLIRFAGTRLAAGNDELVPVRLRRGGRSLGGSLSWDAPKTFAPFPETSPFAGLPVPDEITVSRQILAEPDGELSRRTWAALADGTPVVTAAKRGEGLIVLFHVTADPGWSSLPLSGVFVDMMRRTIALAGRSVAANAGEGKNGADMAAPQRTLDGFGIWRSPPATAKPIPRNHTSRATLDHPPGFYGPSEASIALNTLLPDDRPMALDYGPFAGSLVPIARAATVDLRPFLLLIAALLLIADTIASLLLGGHLGGLGGLRRRPRPRGATAAILALATLAAIALPAGQVRAQGATGEAPQETARELPPISAEEVERAAITRLAYVVTGNPDIDGTSRAGLDGLTRALVMRTALEPGEPVGVDVERDELAFYPLLYWPVVAGNALPSPAALRRLDAYMKGGGTVIFDTRDAMALRFDGAVTPEGQQLRRMLATLDIPELEPVPRDHVLSRAFYILDYFPGRYATGETWVEALPPEDEASRRPARAGDGVSPLIITSNDLAAAWAVGGRGEPLFPVVGPDPHQREIAYRVGINITMYALTGNYKADQVHVPALLERLGQ
ncbi:N-terminal double-transmembrane domain [Chelatococcus sambhunathii]|uniref:N-terminal double-transmembrane domain n=1 Tax=Chelatococcus sambhunathii TaxID=363953 RepID=A0ABM9TYV6_9HYPH|nr:DUF4159 domain-containing protein [Chelatococcus sambhunathii]CUA84367.1 N-terminal double-transmembrane domain [Chelatococcus sambhunathii]